VKAFNQVIQAVKTPQNCTLATARGSNKSSNGVFGNGNVDIPDSFEFTVINVKVFRAENSVGLASNLKVGSHRSVGLN
jgi:hypothetical protein